MCNTGSFDGAVAGLPSLSARNASRACRMLSRRSPVAGGAVGSLGARARDPCSVLGAAAAGATGCAATGGAAGVGSATGVGVGVGSAFHDRRRLRYSGRLRWHGLDGRFGGRCHRSGRRNRRGHRRRRGFAARQRNPGEHADRHGGRAQAEHER